MDRSMSSPGCEHRDHGVAAVLAALRTEVGELAETLWAARSGHELMDTVVEIETLRSTLDSLEFGVVRELEATGAVKAVGWASTQDFVTSVAGGHKGAGPAMVRLAKAVAEPVLGPVGEALGDGWLSTPKAQVIVRAIDTLPGNPDVRARGVQALLAEATSLDATELCKVANRLCALVDPDGDERRDEKALDRLERVAHLERALAITADQAGGAWIRGRCTAEDAALLKATLIPLAAPQPSATGPVCDPATCDLPGCGHKGRDPRDHGARLLDALVEACRRVQGADRLPHSHGAVPRLTVTMSLEDLRATSGFATTETGEQLTASTIRRLCCDAEIIPAVLGADTAVLDVGRAQRLVTAAIWKALVVRDAGCQFPRCTRPPMMCHAHHLDHWAEGGDTSLENLILLCGHHHRLIHATPWTIQRTGPATFDFHPPPGRQLPAPQDAPEAPPDG